MKTFYSMCTLCLLTAFVWFPAISQANAQGLTQEALDAQVQQNLNTPIPCGCSLQDDIDLKNRIALVNMIILEFGAAKQKYAGSKQKLTPEIRSAVQKPIVVRINNEKDPKATDVGAITYDFGCWTHIDFDATPCLRGALDAHEAVHRAACDAHPLGWRFDQTVEDWVQEEIDSYQQERKRLYEEQNKYLPFCKLDPSVQRILRRIAADKEREKEAKEILDWLSGLIN